MNSIRMSPNSREVISAISTITGKQEYLSSTNNILNVNASVSISGSPIPVIGATTAIVTAIVDGSGNQITSFGGGTQYTDGGTPPTHPIGPTLEFNNAGTWATVGSANPLPVSATFSPSGTQDINLKQINGNTTSTGNGTAGTGVQRVTIASDNTAFSVNAIQSGTWNITNISGTISLPTGASTSALQTTGNTSLATIATNTGATPPLPGTLVAFITTITTAGTRVQLGSNSLSQGVVIEAPSTNTGSIYVGGSAVSSSSYGAELQPGQSVGLAVNNTNLVWVDTATNGNKVAVLGG